MPLTRRALELAESTTVRLTSRVAELRAAGRDLVDLGAGEPGFTSPRVAVEAARQALAEGFTRYTPTPGTTDLRQALARRYQRAYAAPWNRSQVVVSCGAKAALFQLMQVLVEEGGEVVLPSPDWVSFRQQVRLAGGRPVPVAMSAEDGFCLRAAPLVAAMNDRTRLVLLNSPANPTGGTMAAEELRQLALACAERGVVLVSDETYERFVWDGQQHNSAAALASELPETVVVVGSFSKTYAMTGWRVGYALGPAALIAKVIAYQGHLTSCATSFAMGGALAALEQAEDEVQQRIAVLAQQRQRAVEQLQTVPGFEVVPPAGAFYVFPRVRGTFTAQRQGSLALAEFLLERAGVAVVPGIAFAADEHLRLSFAAPAAQLEEGLSRIASALA